MLGTGGYIAMTRRTQARDEQAARAARGAPSASSPRRTPPTRAGIRALLEAAARSAADERFGAGAVSDPQLVQVIDQPGTDADQAVFHVETADGEQVVTLGRTGGVWGPA